MPALTWLHKWRGLPSRLALLLGVGALSAAGAEADATPAGRDQQPMRVPQQSVKAFGEMRIWSDDGRVYLSESGGDARELSLGDTPEARHLKELLQHQGAVSAAPQVLQHRLILVGGGGDGFHWGPTAKPNDAAATIVPTGAASETSSAPTQASQPTPAGSSGKAIAPPGRPKG
jgi:hypothetical protein